MSALSRRLPRELRHNLGKYLSIFLMMFLAVGVTCGYLTANRSIETLVASMADTYHTEDGHLTTSFEASDEAIEAAQDLGATLYESFYYDLDFEGGTAANSGITARVYTVRDKVNLAAYEQGKAPEAADEIALDRVFAENNGIEVGDTVEVDGTSYTVCGIMTLSDYTALYESNTSFVFDSITFTVAEVTEEAFDAIADADHSPTYCYSFVLDDAEATLAERTDLEQDMISALQDNGAIVTELLDRENNQAVSYASNDLEGDASMWTWMMLLLIVIMGFAFAVLIGSTIEEESAVVGTLLASGYRKRELVAHYMALPCVIGLVATVLGLLLGSFGIVWVMKDLYYNSYGFPPFEITPSLDVIVLTGILPFVILVGITLAGIVRKLRFTPLALLRHETTHSKRRRGIRLPERLGFSTRFRLRVLLGNAGNFVTLFFGILFACLLLAFGLCLNPTMTNYADMLSDSMVAEHYYTVKAPLELDVLGDNDADAVDQAEKYAVCELEYTKGDDGTTETITVYGIAEDSRYWDDLELDEEEVAFGAGFLDKFGCMVGDEVTLTDRYEDTDYALTCDSSYGERTNMAIYLRIDYFNELFGNDEGYFNGYASNEELDIAEAYLASDLTPADMDKIAAQMVESMSEMSDMLVVLAVVVAVIFIYLLTKTVIDRAARTISQLKAFGYHSGEINRLYLRSITATVVVSLVVSLPVVYEVLALLFKVMMYSYTGNIVVYMPTWAMAASVGVGLASYAVVAAFHTRRIKRVSLALALKAQE